MVKAYKTAERGWKAYAKLELKIDKSYLWMKHISDFFHAHASYEADKVLEIGCTTGRWLKYFELEFSSHVYGIDLEETGLRRMGFGNPILSDAFNLPFKSNSFDIVFSVGLIEHFINPQLILKEAVRVLKAGGHLFSIIPNLSLASFRGIYFRLADQVGFTPARHYKITKNYLEDLYHSLGLNNVACTYMGCFFETFFRDPRIREKMNRYLSKIRNRLFADEFGIVGSKRVSLN